MATQQTPARSGPQFPKETGEIVGLIRRAEQGDESILPQLQALFDGDRGARLVEAFGGDMARTAEQLMVARSSGENMVVREALHRKLAALRAELAGPDPTPIERLLAERAALCWLGVNEFEAAAAQQLGPISIDQADYEQRRLDRAHKRFLMALRTLTAVRKMAVPALQINVAMRQKVTNKAEG
jgi:hypothetical protein